jgi:hypothetical protein
MKPCNFAGKVFYLIVRPNAVAGLTEANCPTAARASHVSKHVLEIVFFPHFLVSVRHCDLPPALRHMISRFWTPWTEASASPAHIKACLLAEVTGSFRFIQLGPALPN